MKIKEGMKIKSPQELIKMGYCFLDEGIIVKNNLKEILREKGLNSVDLAKLIGESRQRVSLILNYKTIPNIDFVLKTSYVLDMPVEEIYEITDNAWKYKPDDVSLYYDMIEKEIITYEEYMNRKTQNCYKYFDIKENEPLTENQFKKRKKEIDEIVQEKKLNHISHTRVEKNLDLNEIKRDMLEKRFVKVYRKIGVKITPYKV